MGIDRNARQMTFRPMPLLPVLSVISLIILLMLGSWQYERYSEKIGAPQSSQTIDVPINIRVEIDRAHLGNAQQVYGFADSEPIWRRYAPGRVIDTDEAVLVLVDATGGARPVPVALTTMPETIAFEGILARKRRNDSSFNAQDNPAQDEWYSLSPKLMWENLGREGVPMIAEPIVMTIRNASDQELSRLTANPYAYSKPLDPLPPERHFGYALTWWGMAIGLIGVYVALHRARGRLKF